MKKNRLVSKIIIEQTQICKRAVLRPIYSVSFAKGGSITVNAADVLFLLDTLCELFVMPVKNS